MPRSAISAFCAALSLALFSAPSGATATTIGPTLFGSVVLSVPNTPFDARWSRIQSQGLGAASRIATRARSLRGLERLRFVNAAVNRAIQYNDDSKTWGAADFWASAAETFSRGAGDCEDYAIAKLLVLRASGVPPTDLFLVIGNDVAARGAHAMLVVRVEGDYWVLDNMNSDVLADRFYSDFRPIITLSAGERWLHGYRTGTGPTSNGSARSSLSGRRLTGTALASVLAAQSHATGQNGTAAP